MRESIRPDEVIPPPGGSQVQVRALVRDVAFMLPNLLKLLTRLVKDPRVPRRSKLLVGGALAYLASPIDLIPEAIPVLGIADDILIVAYSINHLIDKAGLDVVEEHWEGPQDLLEMVRTILDSMGTLIPPKLRGWLDRLSG